MIREGISYASARACNLISCNFYMGNKKDDNNRNDWDAMIAAQSYQVDQQHVMIDVTKIGKIDNVTSYGVLVILNYSLPMQGTSITIPDGTDLRVYLQSHWGSGVTFSNLTISSK